MVTRKVLLSYPESLIQEPVLFRMVRQFDIVPNIRRARVTETVGEIVLELKGEEAEIERGVAYLRAQGVEVSPIEGDLVSP